MDDFELQRWKQMHEIARHYDNQLRAIPVLTLALVSLEVGAFNFQNFISIQNIVVASISMVVSGFFLFLFYKIHFQQLRMSRALKQRSDDLASYYTIEARDIRKEIEELGGGEYPYWTTRLQRWLILQSAGKAVKLLTIMAIIVNFSLIVYITFELFRINV